MSDTLVVLTNMPDNDTARDLAGRLLEHRLAACINILAPCTSVFRWEDTLEDDSEVPMLIKTTTERYAALESLILEHHPYELPEIIAIPVAMGLPGYLSWVAAETHHQQL